MSYAALLLLASPTPALADVNCPEAGQGFQRLAATGVEVAYRWEPSELKVGRFFSAEVIACQPAGAVTRMVLDATMPAHGHGMNYLPKTTEAAPGHYRFTGLMFHMAGRWRVSIDLYRGDSLLHRLTSDIDLKP